MLIVTAQAMLCETLEQANEYAKEAAAQNGSEVFIANVIGKWRPVTEPVEFVPIEMPIIGAPQPERPKRERAAKSQPNEIPAPSSAKAVIDSYDHFAALAAEPKAGTEIAPAVAAPANLPDGRPAADWKCPGCGQTCFKTQLICRCGCEFDPFADNIVYLGAEALAQAEPKTHPSNDAETILRNRCGDEDDKCRRCGANTIHALVNGMRVRICSKDDCIASEESRQTYDMLYGDPLANEPEMPTFAGDMAKKAVAAKPEGSPNLPEGKAAPAVTGGPLERAALAVGAPIPSESDIATSGTYLGITIENPPAEWGEEPITKEGGESDGGQCKALNSALTDAGYGGTLRHPACVAILGQVRALDSLSDLTKAEAHICLTWFEKAQAEDIAELARVLAAHRKVVI